MNIINEYIQFINDFSAYIDSQPGAIKYPYLVVIIYLTYVMIKKTIKVYKEIFEIIS